MVFTPYVSETCIDGFKTDFRILVCASEAIHE